MRVLFGDLPPPHPPFLSTPGLAPVTVTGQRHLVWAAGSKRVDIPFGHPLRSAVKLSVEKTDRLCIACDAGAFNPDRSGQIEYRFRTAHAATIAWMFG